MTRRYGHGTIASMTVTTHPGSPDAEPFCMTVDNAHVEIATEMWWSRLSIELRLEYVHDPYEPCTGLSLDAEQADALAQALIRHANAMRVIS